jgi:hypothetical protein
MNKKVRQVIRHDDGDFKEFYFFKIGEPCKETTNRYGIRFSMPTYFNDKDGADIYEHDTLEVGGKYFSVVFSDGAYKMKGDSGIIYPIIPDIVKVLGHIYDRSNKY